MSLRLKHLTLACLVFLSFGAMAFSVTPAAAAASPWWQVLTGSRPTNFWEPEDSMQEIETEIGSFGSFEGVAAKIEVEGEVIGCLGTADSGGSTFCGFLVGFPPTATAVQLEAVLEAAFGTSAVEVSGGPVGGEPFKVIVPNRFAPAIRLSPTDPRLGSATSKVLLDGGSGRLVSTFTNLGDQPVDASSTPVTILDRLPEGVEATGVEAFAGAQDSSGPVVCEVKASNEVSCTFDGELPPYEAIEVEVLGSLVGEPPTQGGAGEVSISGGDAPGASAPQAIRVSPAPASFGIERFSAQAEEEGGFATTHAGRHPFQLTTTIQLNSGKLGDGRRTYEQPAIPRNLRFPLPVGLVGNAHAMSQCPVIAFLHGTNFVNECPDSSTIGVAAVTVVEETNFGGLIRLAVPVFNLPPQQGEPARFGFVAAGAPVIIDTDVDPDNQYRITASVRNATQVAKFLSSTLTLWGSPGDPRHDNARGWGCVYFKDLGIPCERPAGLQETAFLRQPVSCATPLDFKAEIEPWNVPIGSVVEKAESGSSNMLACNQVPFDPTIAATPTGKQSGGPAGLDFRLDMPNAGLLDPKAKAAEGQAKRVEVILPEGMTVNPSQAEGLAACSSASYAQETASSLPGEGCPEASKIGTVRVSTPLLAEEASGAVYVAKPYDNPFNSLVALYVVARIPERGILIKQAGKVELNSRTGHLATTFDDLPQLPFSTFKLHLRDGSRAPLVMPASCGTYDVVTKFTPWSAADPDHPRPSEIVTRVNSFTVDQGASGGPCPSGTPPFKPGFTAGTASNGAGSYSPFSIRLTRQDNEQEFSRFSVKLPKGVIGKLAGIPFCSDAAVAAAEARTGLNGGREELDNPSCPAASQIGHTLVGAGVGSTLTYVPGKIYLAGPYQGAKLSIVAITATKVGPFDLGNVVIRQALRIDPETAEVTSDGIRSDPIPHILQGIVVHARDIRANIDRPNFVLNPTNCKRRAVASTVIGSGLDFGSAGDDQPADVSDSFQAADCASLDFKPKLSLTLLGGTKRSDTPRLKAVLKARKGDANIGRAQVTLPHSAFLEQAHIRTICTRVQFNAGGGNGEQCPKASVYGKAKAISPLLDEPLKGPVYLRSSSHELPDLVAALGSRKVDINLVGRIDSLNGRIRNTFEMVPDAPVTKFTLEMQGGQKGLIVNSVNICKGKHRAIADFKGQNGRRHLFNPIVKAKCGGKMGSGRR